MAQGSRLGSSDLWLSFSNLGFMGYPVCETLFGGQSLFYVTLINIPFGLLVFTVGIYLLRPDIITQYDLKRILNPGLFASLIGLLFFFCNFTIPHPISDSLSLLGSVTTPLAMIVIGSLLATLPAESLFGDLRIWFISAARLIIIPLLVFLCLRLFITDTLLIFVPVMLFCNACRS